MDKTKKKTNDPDGPLPKWGEPEGVKQAMEKTPGQNDVNEVKLRTDVPQNKGPQLSAAAKKKLRNIARPTDMSDMKKTIAVGSRMEETELDEAEMVKTMKKSTSDLKREYEKLSGKKAPAGTSDQVLQLRINRLKTQKESIELQEAEKIDKLTRVGWMDGTVLNVEEGDISILQNDLKRKGYSKSSSVKKGLETHMVYTAKGKPDVFLSYDGQNDVAYVSYNKRSVFESVELEEKVMNSDKAGPGKGKPMKSLSRDEHMAAMRHHEQEQMKHDRAGNTKQGNYHADMAKAHRHSTGGSAQSWKEEVEQVDEVSTKTLQSYYGKATDQAKSYRKALMKTGEMQKKQDKRTAGARKASQIINKRNMANSPLAKYIKKEEVEQVDEVSKDMKQRYLDKAVPSHYNKFVGREKTTKQQLDKRRAAIQKVSQQLKGKKHFSDFGEEVDLEEGVYDLSKNNTIKLQRHYEKMKSRSLSDKDKEVMVAMKAELIKRGALKEEVEQVEENMDQYKKITAAQYKKIYDKHKAANAKGGNFGAHRSMTKHPEHGVIHQVYSHKSHNLPSIWKTADGKKHWMKEEVEQVDELKKSTLKSYLQKTANKPSTGKWDKTDKGRMGANCRLDGKFYHKGSKHDPKTGEVIPSKYKAEEVDLEEGIEYHAHGKVFKKKGEAIAHHAKKRGNKSDSYAVHRVDTKTNTITHGFDSQGRSKHLGFDKAKYDKLKAGKSLGEGVDEAKDYNAEIQRHKDIASKQRGKMSKATSHADMIAAMNRHMKAKKNQKSLTRAQAHMEAVGADKDGDGANVPRQREFKGKSMLPKHDPKHANLTPAQRYQNMMKKKMNKEEVELDEITSPEIKAAYAAAMKTKAGTSQRKAAVQKYQKLRLQAIDDKKTRKEEVELDEDYSKKSTASLQKTHDKWKDRPMSPADANQLKMIRRELQKRGAMKKEEVELDEKLNPSMGAGEYVKDFRDSDAPQFKGKSDKKKQKMAIAAYLDAKRKQQDEAYGCSKSKKKVKKEEVELDEGKVDVLRQKTKDKIKPEFHDKYDFNKVKNAQTMLNMLNRAQMYKHLKEAKYSVDVDGLPRFYMDADSPAQVKIALRKLLKKASDIDSVERVNDARIKQDLRQRLKGAETDKRQVDE